MTERDLIKNLKDNNVSNKNITDNNSNDNIKALKVVSEFLKLPLNDIKEYTHKIKNEPTLLYISIPVKGGESLIIDKNTLEFLYANSSVSFERHLEEYKKGTRNKKEDFINYK